jgi:hypothetical protein
MKTTVRKIQEAISSVLNGVPSERVLCDTEEASLVIHVVSRREDLDRDIRDEDIILVVPDRTAPHAEDEDGLYSSWSVVDRNKRLPLKEYIYYLDEKGEFIENFPSIEKMMAFHDILDE